MLKSTNSIINVTQISGVLPVAKGGTGVTTSTGTGANAQATQPQFTNTVGVGTAAAASGSGVSFPAVQSASTDPNTLDDYEEGPWSPVLSFTTPPTTPFTMDVVTATYTKIGRVVHVQAFFRTDSVDLTGAAGFLLVSGLPFTASGFAPAYVSSVSNWVTAPDSGYVDNGSTRIFLLSRAASNGSTSLMGTGTVTAGASADQNAIMIAATYFV
jgi:hypothetical protein